MNGEITNAMRLQAAKPAEGRSAEDRLIEDLYKDLRKLAQRYLSYERRNHTLQATALVHEAYLRLAGANIDWQDRTHFLAVAASTIRRVLVDHARALASQKRAGVKVSLHTIPWISEQHPVDIIALNTALEKYGSQFSQQAEIINLNFFLDLPDSEISQLLNISVQTVKRARRHARAWLFRELTQPNGDAGSAAP